MAALVAGIVPSVERFGVLWTNIAAGIAALVFGYV